MLSISKLQKLLWKECRRVADIIYKPKDGIYRCYTCGSIIGGKNKQLGHFLAKSICGAKLKYDMRNLRWQCYRCNISLSGNGAVFYRKLVEENGQEYVDKLFEEKSKSVKAYDVYLKQLSDYEQI